MDLLAIMFWCCAIGAVYSFLIYPLILILLIRFRRGLRHPKTAEDQPRIALIITVYNEARRIRAKIENTLELDLDGLECDVIIASDHSADETHAIVEEYAASGVQLFVNPGRDGKEATQRKAISETDAEIIVFSDAATLIEPSAIKLMLEEFRDPEVGAVSSVDRIINDDGQVASEGLYVKYEMALRRLESVAGSLVGLSGSFFAMRREITERWDSRIPSDFGAAIYCVQHGLRAVQADDAIGFYQDLADPAAEYARKLRTIVRGMRGLKTRADVMNPFRYGFFAFQVISHKLMRWAMPWFLIGVLVTNVLLVGRHGFYQATLVAQALLYSAALLPTLRPETSSIAVIRIARYFIGVNLAMARAFIEFARGASFATWQPSER